MRKLGFACVLAGLLLMAGAALLHWKGSLLSPVPPGVARFERSLAQPGLLGLASLDLAALFELGVAGDPGGAEHAGSGLAAQLAAAGIDLRRDVRFATLALSAAADAPARVAVALFGRFDAVAIERALRQRDDLRVSDARAGGEPLLHVVRIDRDSCEESGPWALHLGPERLLLAEPDAIAALLEEGAASEAALRDLSRFQAFRSGRLVSAALFVPAELPLLDNPLVGMAAHGAKQQVEGFRAIYAGAAPQLLPAGLAIDALLEGTRPGLAAEKADAWQRWLDERFEGLAEKLPTLATLHDALELRAEDDDLVLRARLSREQLERLERVPEELLGLVFGAGFQLAGEPAAAGEEQLAEQPRVFQAEVGEASLSAYDPSVTFAEPVDQVAGPFGVRLSAIRLTRGAAGGDGPIELELEAFATHIPNLGSADDRVAIAVSGVEGLRGEALLARESCGPERNELPALLSNHFGGDLLRGTKKVRLVEGAEPGDLARVRGVATLRLPTRTERVTLAAQPGSLERAGARLTLSQVQGGSVSYELAGATQRLLQLRALNASGQPLAEQSASSMSSFGGGLRAAQAFAGQIHSLEAVFALEEQELRFPFELSELRPGSAGELVAGAAELAGVDALAIRGAFEDWLAGVAAPIALLRDGEDASGSPATRAGPFALRLEGLWPFGGLMPRIEVRAPQIPGLEDSPSAVELRLSELRMLDGSSQRGDWREALDMSREFGGEGLAATSQLETGVSASPDDVQSLHGEIRIRLPARVRRESLAHAELGAALDTPALSLRLVELGRDRFVLRASRGGERVLGARAFNTSGAALFTQHESTQLAADGVLELAFQARGVPSRIELRIAEQLSEAAYPWSLASGDRTVALAP